MTELPHRPLGSSGIEVSCLALGSWRTYERMSREDGVAVMRAARGSGIDFLDDARYNDETGSAPLPTGYSEVVFGELFRAAGWERDRVTVANKLWWEFWPEQTAADELDGSLGRMGLEHGDLIYTEPPPAGLELAEPGEQVVGLISTAKTPEGRTENKGLLSKPLFHGPHIRQKLNDSPDHPRGGLPRDGDADARHRRRQHGSVEHLRRPPHEPERAPVGDRRLHPRARHRGAHVRFARRPPRPQEGVPRRPRGVHGVVARVRAVGKHRDARRRTRGAGTRRRRDVRGVAGAACPRVPRHEGTRRC